MASDMTGLNSERLAMSVKKNLTTKIMASQTIIFSVGLDGMGYLLDFCNILSEVVAEEIVKEITMHSVLEPTARDAGIAGSGIIAGSLK